MCGILRYLVISVNFQQRCRYDWDWIRSVLAAWRNYSCMPTRCGVRMSYEALTRLEMLLVAVAMFGLGVLIGTMIKDDGIKVTAYENNMKERRLVFSETKKELILHCR